MLSTKKAESLVGIVIGVFILSFVLIGIGSLIGSSKGLIRDFDRKMDLDILTSSSYAIINSLTLDNLSDGDIFYLHKNDSSKTFDIYVGESNFEYKYIDKYGNKIDEPLNFNGDVYSRIFQAKKVEYQGQQKIAIKSVIKRLLR